jgi:hypothetical protein
MFVEDKMATTADSRVVESESELSFRIWIQQKLSDSFRFKSTTLVDRDWADWLEDNIFVQSKVVVRIWPPGESDGPLYQHAAQLGALLSIHQAH